MPFIPENFVADLLQRADIVDVIHQQVPLKKSGANYMACCPFHNESTPSFSVNASKQFYYCFGCHASGDAVRFLMNHNGLTFPEAIEALAAQYGLTVPYETQSTNPEATQQRKKTHNRYQACMEIAVQFYQQQLKNFPIAQEYLKKRGLDGAIALRFQLGYAPNEWQNLQQPFADYADNQDLATLGLVKDKEGRRYDTFRHRIIYPIVNKAGEVVGFGGRSLGDEMPKYLNSPETPIFNKGQELYGWHLAKTAIHRQKRVIVVEGYMDVIALVQAGVEEAVATLGTALTEAHLVQLFKTTKSVYLCFDGDSAGQKAALRAAELALTWIRDEDYLRFITLPNQQDPDEFVRTQGSDGFELQIKKAKPLSELWLESLRLSFNLEIAEERSQLIHRAAQTLQKVRAMALKKQLVNMVAEHARTSAADIESVLSHMALEDRQLSSISIQKNTMTSSQPLSSQPFSPTRMGALSQRQTSSPGRWNSFGRNKPPEVHNIQMLALLLAHPSLVAHIPSELLQQGVGRKELAMVLTLQRDLAEEGELSHVHVLERIKAEVPAEALRLIMQDSEAYENTGEAQALFEDCVLHLTKEHNQNRLQMLMKKQQQGELLSADEDKEFWQRQAYKKSLI